MTSSTSVVCQAPVPFSTRRIIYTNKSVLKKKSQSKFGCAFKYTHNLFEPSLQNVEIVPSKVW